MLTPRRAFSLDIHSRREYTHKANIHMKPVYTERCEWKRHQYFGDRTLSTGNFKKQIFVLLKRTKFCTYIVYQKLTEKYVQIAILVQT